MARGRKKSLFGGDTEMKRFVIFYSALILIIAGVLYVCWADVVNYSFRAW